MEHVRKVLANFLICSDDTANDLLFESCVRSLKDSLPRTKDEPTVRLVFGEVTHRLRLLRLTMQSQ